MTLKDIIKITLNLVIIYIIGGVILAGVCQDFTNYVQECSH
jgi:sRNA-binding regulator protein Hfq